METAAPLISPGPEPLTYKIGHTSLVNRLKAEAEKNGRHDWWVYADEVVERAVKMILGLEVDMTPKEAAQHLGCHLNSIWNYHRQGLFPHSHHTPNGRLRIPYKDVVGMKRGTRKLSVTE